MTSAYSVKSKEIVICGQRFVVKQANTLEASMRYVKIQDAENKWNEDNAGKQELTLEEVILKRELTILYPTAICVTSSLDEPLPAVNEFITMPFEEKENWLSTVRELNPQFFPEFEDSEEEAEKKS